jgi:hypothetical protein
MEDKSACAASSLGSVGRDPFLNDVSRPGALRFDVDQCPDCDCVVKIMSRACKDAVVSSGK